LSEVVEYEIALDSETFVDVIILGEHLGHEHEIIATLVPGFFLKKSSIMQC
jgi:hypothetical protein